MKIDTIIRNGHVIDPSQKLNEVRTIGIDNGRIVDVTEDMTAVTEINAEGCYVFPGLIDFHVHAFGDASGWGVDSKDMFLATGVTSICDQGSAGKTNYEAFHKTVVEPGLVRVRSFLNIYNGGTLDMGFDEILDSKRFDVKGIRKVLDKYHDEILGIKIRLSKAITGQYGYEPFPKTVSIARELGLPVCIHITDPPCRQAEIADLFQAGDIMCHCFHGRGETILGKDGKIDPAIWAARERGVIFDVAHGHTNFSFRIIRQALEEGFLPDVLSTDMCRDKLNISTKTRTLTQVMCLYLNLGLSLPDVIRMVTETPARLMKMEGSIGTLKTGALGDVSIFKLKKDSYLFTDYEGVQMRGTDILIPQMTFVGGVAAFCQADFNLTH